MYGRERADRPPAGMTSFGREVPSIEVSARLKVDLSSPRRARHLMSAALDDTVPEPVVDDAVLLASEVVTNAVCHGGGAVELNVIQLERSVLVEVSDRSTSLPTRMPADPARDESGRGLLLLESLAERWGTRMSPPGKVVWYEVAIPAAS